MTPQPFPSITRHRQALAASRQLTQRNKTLRHDQPIEHLAREHRDTLNLETTYIAHLTRRTEAQWLHAISALRGNVQIAVACVVWWDFFGGRKADPNKSAFAPFLESRAGESLGGASLVSRQELQRGLLVAGYSKVLAAQRAIGKERAA